MSGGGRKDLAPALRTSVNGYEVSSVWFVSHGVEVCETAVRQGGGPWMVLCNGAGGYGQHDYFVEMAADGVRPWRLDAWLDY